METAQKPVERVVQKGVAEVGASMEEEIVWNVPDVGHETTQPGIVVNPHCSVIIHYRMAPRVVGIIVAKVAGLKTHEDVLIQK